jgi:hypothetical protein
MVGIHAAAGKGIHRPAVNSTWATDLTGSSVISSRPSACAQFCSVYLFFRHWLLHGVTFGLVLAEAAQKTQT